MNGYLVLLKHTMDDLPLFFTEDYEAATQFADKQPEMPTDEQRKALHADCSTPCSIWIVKFAEGVPVEANPYKGFDA